MSNRLHDALLGALERNASRIRVVDGEGTPWTGEGLLRGAKRWLGEFKALDLRAGDRISVALPNGGAFLQLFLACLEAGVTFCPVPSGLSPAEERRRTEALDARVHVRALSRLSVHPEMAVGPEGAGSRPSQLRVSSRPARPEVAAILWSSGTSGRPRAVGLTPDNLCAQVASHLEPLALGPESRLVNYLSWSHCFGLGVELLPALLAGARVDVNGASGRDTVGLMKQMEQVQPTHFYSVPRVLGQLVTSSSGWSGMGALEGGVVGGAVLTPMLSQLLTSTGWRLRQGYGQTECSPGVSLGAWGDFRAGCLGVPVGCETRLLETTELAVRGPNVTACTWVGEPPGRDGGWLCTGDLARRDPDGTLWWEGRLDDCFKLANGRMVNPHLLERRWLASQHEATEVVAVGAGALHPTLLVRGGPLEAKPSALSPGPDEVPVAVLPESIWRECETATGKVLRKQVALAWETWRGPAPA